MDPDLDPRSESRDLMTMIRICNIHLFLGLHLSSFFSFSGMYVALSRLVDLF